VKTRTFHLAFTGFAREPNGVSKLKGKPVFHFTNDATGACKGGSGVVNVDGGQASTPKMPHTIPFRAVLRVL
jgi:hypothetical protein